MVQTAKVTRILENGLAEVAVKRQSACGHDCSQCGGCSEMLVSQTVAVVAENPVRAMPGDTVTVESATGRVLRAAALLYLVPFALFFVLYRLAISLGAPEGDCGRLCGSYLASGRSGQPRAACGNVPQLCELQRLRSDCSG